MAYDIGPRIGIDGEREYREQIKNINQQMKTLDSQLQLTASGFTEETSAQEKARAKTETLTKQISLQEQKLKEQTEMLERSKEKTGETSTQTQKYQEIVNKTKTKLNQMKADLEKTSESTKTMGDRMKEAGEKIQNAGAKMKGLGDNMNKYVSAPLGAIAGISVKSFNELDDAMDITIQKTGATGKEAENLKQAFKDVAGSIEGANASFEDSAKAVGEINTRFGFTGKQLDTVSKDFLKFAQVNGSDVEGSVQAVSRAMENAGADASEYKDYLDALTVAGQKSGISIDKLSENLTKYGAPMRQLGYDAKESIAIFSQWEKSGVNVETAFTGMRTAVNKFNKEGKDAKTEFRKLVTGIKNGTVDSATAMKYFGSKAGTEMIEVIKEGKFEFDDMIDAITGSKGALDNTFDGIIDDGDKAKAAINNLKVKLGELGGEIIEKAAPMVEKLLGGISGLLDGFNNLPEPIQNAALAIGGIGVVGGPALSGIGRITEGIGGIVSKLGEGDGGLLKSIKNIATSPAGFAALEGAGLLALAAIGGEIVNMTTGNGALKQLHESIQESAKEFDNMTAAREREMQAINSEHDQYSALVAELDELVDANGRVKGGYEDRVNFILGQLNSAYGTEGQLVDGMIEKYDDFKKSIEEATNARRAQALLEAQESEYSEALQKIVQAKKDMDEAETALNTTHTKSMAEVARLNRAYDTAKGVYEGYANTIATYETAEAAARKGNFDEAIQISNSLIDLNSNEVRSEQEKANDEIAIEQKKLDVLKTIYNETKSETTKAMIDAAEKRISTLKGEKTAVAKTTNEIVAEYEKATSGAKKAGANVGQGFIDGMDAKTQAIINKSARLAQSAINAFANTYQIKSPSRVMERMAGYAYAGWERGSEKELPKLTSQSAEMAKNINTAFSNSFAMARSSQFDVASAKQARVEAAAAVDTVRAFKDALQSVKIVLDDQIAGRFVEKTVTDVVFSAGGGSKTYSALLRG